MKRLVTLGALLILALPVQADVIGDLKQWYRANAESNHMAETVVVAPGYKMGIAGKSIPVFGTQVCPCADGVRVFFFGGDPQGGDGCIVIEKGTTSVLVKFPLDDKVITEMWTVERRADRTLLRRPNGDYLAQAN